LSFKGALKRIYEGREGSRENSKRQFRSGARFQGESRTD